MFGKHAIAAAFLAWSASVGCVGAQVKVTQLNDRFSVDTGGKPFTSLFTGPTYPSRTCTLACRFGNGGDQAFPPGGQP
jgi:hypothetical protein